jgi:S-adenosylmethionine:tRNA ribosyltransferase-isomerase
MKLADFDYHLLGELIAQTPVEPRDHSRLMIVNRADGSITHDHFYNLLKYLNPDDLLVFNETKVFPARLFGHKPTGGKVEILLLNMVTGEYISHPGLKEGQEVVFDDTFRAVVQNERLKFNVDYDQLKVKINEIGHTPLPPYIDASVFVENTNLRRRYQTVYAKNSGSVAAPTAGFHFTEKLLSEIPNKAFLTLHVGLGTFRPVKTENIKDHEMHSEVFEIPSDPREKILKAKRVIAVGTTSARALESDWDKPDTNIFIYPGYKFKHVDGLITNFHLPKSTLLMLISALAGKDLIMKAYQEAIKEKYRFYSFGDAMLII